MDANYRYSISKGEIYAKQGEKRGERALPVAAYDAVVFDRDLSFHRSIGFTLPLPSLLLLLLPRFALDFYVRNRTRVSDRKEIRGTASTFSRFLFHFLHLRFFFIFLFEIIRQVTKHVATSARLSRIRFRRQIVIVDFGDILIEVLQIQLFLIDYLNF